MKSAANLSPRKRGVSTILLIHANLLALAPGPKSYGLVDTAIMQNLTSKQRVISMKESTTTNLRTRMINNESLAREASLVLKVAVSLAQSYVENAGLLEDDWHKYIVRLLPHARAVIEVLKGDLKPIEPSLQVKHLADKQWQEERHNE